MGSRVRPPAFARCIRDARRRGTGCYSCDVQFGQRIALIEMVVGEGSEAGRSTELLIRFTCLTTRKTARAMMRKLMISFRNCP